MLELLEQARTRCKATTDTELAECLGITQQALSLYRTGGAFPGWETCERWSKVTGMELGEILARVAAARRAARSEVIPKRTA